jgi:hypothetical protein
MAWTRPASTLSKLVLPQLEGGKNKNTTLRSQPPRAAIRVAADLPGGSHDGGDGPVLQGTAHVVQDHLGFLQQQKVQTVIASPPTNMKFTAPGAKDTALDNSRLTLSLVGIVSVTFFHWMSMGSTSFRACSQKSQRVRGTVLKARRDFFTLTSTRVRVAGEKGASEPSSTLPRAWELSSSSSPPAVTGTMERFVFPREIISVSPMDEPFGPAPEPVNE